MEGPYTVVRVPRSTLTQWLRELDDQTLVDLLRTRLISFLMVLCFCVLLIVAVAASAALAIIAKFF